MTGSDSHFISYERILEAAREYAGGFQRFDLSTVTYALGGQLNYSVPTGGGGWFRSRVRRAMEQLVSEAVLDVFPAGTELPNDGTSPHREYWTPAAVVRAAKGSSRPRPPAGPGPDEPRHPFELLKPPGEDEPVEIDKALVLLIRALWAAGFETVTCCQDLGESIAGLNPRKAAYWKGWVLVELPAGSARRLAELAAAHGFPMHWTRDDAWEMSVPVIMLGARSLLAPLVQVHFPAGQLDRLTAVIEDCGKDFR